MSAKADTSRRIRTIPPEALPATGSRPRGLLPGVAALDAVS
jgi:hypothetical protein